MKFKSNLLAIAALTVISTATMAQQGKGTNEGEPTKPTASSQAVDSLATAASLVRYGDANKDALSLITAARIMALVGSSDSKAETVSTAGASEKKENKATVEAILARAKQYAGARADLVALANDAALATRGAVPGPGRKTTVVGRGMTDVYRVTFRGGEPARVLVSGDGDSDLDLYVHDENGNLICKDDDGTDDMVCGWNPRWTGAFSIRVKNLGMANQYTIVHN